VDDDLRGRSVRCRECEGVVFVEGPSVVPERDATAHPEIVPELPAGREKSARAGRWRGAALRVGIAAVVLGGLLAGAWALDLFGLRSRWATLPPPAVLRWDMPERVGDGVFGRRLRDESRQAGRALLVVEVQLSSLLLDKQWGVRNWSPSFQGADLSLVTPDGKASAPVLITALDDLDMPMPFPAGFDIPDSWIPGNGACRVSSHGPDPVRYKVKAAFVVPRASVQAGGFHVQYRGVASAPVPRRGAPAGP
jgi:hypothetical protein